MTSRFFTPQEIRQFTNAGPEKIGSAEFFLDDHSNDEALKRAIGYREPYMPPELAPQGSREAAGGNSLVQWRKSPTREQIYARNQLLHAEKADLAAKPEKDRIRAKRERIRKWAALARTPKLGENAKLIPPFAVAACAPITLDWQKNPVKCLQAHGFVVNAPVIAKLQHREWSNEWRIRVTAQSRPSEAPPTQAGDRLTKHLTQSSVSKIITSGAYVQVLRGGFTTFTTLTFSQEQRERVLTPKPQSKNRTKPGIFGAIVVMKPQGREPLRLKAEGAFTWLDDMGKEGDLAAVNPEEIKQVGEDDSGSPLFDIGAPSIRACGPYSKVRAFTPDSTVGKEVSHFIDLAQKAYQRGWIPNYMPRRTKPHQAKEKQAGEKCGRHIAAGPFTPIRKGDQKDKIKQNPRWKNSNGKWKQTAVPLDYIWVAEMPANEDGEPNPHVHLLMRWEVPGTHFHAWAGRLEKMWGNGFAKLERIKHAKAGANYIVKAVGYTAKGGKENQGLIRGNRYSISQSARAEGFEDIMSWQADNMAAIIAECEEKLARTNAHHDGAASRAQMKLKKQKKIHQITKKSKKFTEEEREKRLSEIKVKMATLDEEILAAQQAKRERGVFASGHWQITFTGSNATHNLDNFLGWAVNNRHWQANARNDYIKQELEQAKEEAIINMRLEYSAIESAKNPSDSEIQKLEYLYKKLESVQQEIDYQRRLRIQLANNLRQQRAYWRKHTMTKTEQRTSTEWWASFLNRYEPPEQSCMNQLLTDMHSEDLRMRA
ncbi:rolling circle replication-associated protein [Grimontia marina]|uniref:Replication-associated protein ORF2/G2P domain-containing protein n=1 Tax=Grimontia marina TaxID=646534 RepID=A0A128F8R1_9GAMM|nr:hypothetical protein [Grimontia marina]CZF83162.1 hypothetical protein GMA8713_02506 [Grimontia marina]